MGLVGGSELELTEILADSTAGSSNPFDQIDRLLRARHGGDLALQAVGARSVGGFSQQRENVCPDGRGVDIRRSQAPAARTRSPMMY